MIAPILGAVITTVNFVQKWDEWQLPRALFTHDLRSHEQRMGVQIRDLQDQILELEVKFLEFAIRSYSRNLRMIHQEIQDLRNNNQKAPDNLLEYQEILTTELSNLRIRLREIRP